jgi:hypothetical protein
LIGFSLILNDPIFWKEVTIICNAYLGLVKPKKKEADPLLGQPIFIMSTFLLNHKSKEPIELLLQSEKNIYSNLELGISKTL